MHVSDIQCRDNLKSLTKQTRADGGLVVVARRLAAGRAVFFFLSWP